MNGYKAFTGAAMVALITFGCTPSEPRPDVLDQQLESHRMSEDRAYLPGLTADAVVELKRPPNEVAAKLTQERLDELNEMSGLDAYGDTPLEIGVDLEGNVESPTIAMSLQEAIDTAVRNNIVSQLARLGPALSKAQLARAEGAFDATFFTNFDFQKLDTPQPLLLAESSQSDTRTLTTGLRKLTSTGAQVTAQTEISRLEDDRFDSLLTEHKYYATNVAFTVAQPLLRNFGTDVNRSQIFLAENAMKGADYDLRTQLIDIALQTEATYWRLFLARQRLLIQLRLLDRTIKDRDQLVLRGILDVSPVQITEANSFVQLRRGDVIRARESLRQESDALKQLLNSSDLPVTSETQILPKDSPVDLPMSFNLLDAVTAALRNRPDLQRAMLEISDAAIRQKVADNQKLPILNLAATARFNGQGQDVGDAYDQLTDGNFIDYLVTAQYEMPIGNRQAEALFQQRKIERLAALMRYRRQEQQVILEVKTALRSVNSSYELIGSTRAARLAASDDLRTRMEQEKAGAAMTPEFLDAKLRSQERLAASEVEEASALANYNTAIAALYQTMGTLLDRNGIEVVE